MEKKLEELSKKGTTTVGIVCKNGLVLAADKRATLGYLVAHAVVKIEPVTDRVAMTLAGMVGDAQKLLSYLKAQMQLYELKKRRKPSVKACATLLSHILYSNRFSPWPFWVQLLLGGLDEKGFHLFSLGPDGSFIEDKCISTGSGSPVAYGVLEDAYVKDLDKKDGVKLAVRAINAATKREIHTGEGIDVVVIDESGIKRLTGEEVKKVLKETKKVK